ncbi:DMT family transporter [Companilactobacillus suantsaicola]|uniref:DMT family transporter n=1 Tax=Companilactobacillus suantsaicola TaxID=2487723 RepID=A0A4Z0JJF6_9LACO|nr:DMT family transporter [Companilactobacillus suantsaicola]TGD21891.1 DMT family transporter [Companilactobacillus suantsaicola]
MLTILIGLFIGIGLPIQTSINTRLKNTVGSPFVASLISFSIGTIFLAVITLIKNGNLLIPLKIIMKEPLWIWIGGLLGVIYLTSNILLFPKLGSVQTAIMPIMGQIIMGLLIDNFGLFDSPVKSLTAMRIFGAVLVVIGVIGAVSSNQIIAKKGIHLTKQNRNHALTIWRIVGVVVGMFSASQTAINGHLGIVLKSAIKAAFVSFFVGTVALILIVALLHPVLTFDKSRKNPFWMWFGGVIGALFVLGNVYMVPLIGTGLAVVIVLVGLVSGSLLIDQFGWFNSQKNPISLPQIISLIVMIAGVITIRLL